MEFTSEDDPPHIRLGKTLRNYTMIGYYSILRKLNNIEEDGEILTRAGTFDKYWEEKKKLLIGIIIYVQKCKYIIEI